MSPSPSPPSSRTDVVIVGTVDSSRRALVDAGGRVIMPAGWALAWHVGADDRWHVPLDEASTRQSRLRDAPVVETRVRIPSGDAVGWAYGIQGPSAEGANDYVVLEVANESPVPVAIGFTFESIVGPSVAPVDVSLEGTVVRVGGEAALLFSSPPHPDPDHGFLVPVPHRTSVRIALPLSPTSTYPSIVPSPEQVAAGWEAQVRRGARADLPDPARQSRFETGRRDLLLRTAGDHPFEGIGELTVAPRSPAALAVALDELGFRPEAGLLLAGLVEDADDDLDGARRLLAALVRHDELTDDQALARATRRFRKRAARVSARSTTPAGPVPVDAMSEHRADIVDDAPDGIVLLAGWQPGWAGQPVEAHGFPTRFGSVSFGVRWHGERLALLWEVHAEREVALPRLRVPAIDPSWSTDAPVGEALLAPLSANEAVER